MAERDNIFRCNVCGHIIEVIHKGGGDLVCCDQKMEKLEAKTSDEGQEKHVPVAEMIDDGALIKVGSVEHPMEEDHYIEWIQIIHADKRVRKYLKPGDKPEFVKHCKGGCEIDSMKLREYCNKHGLWSNK